MRRRARAAGILTAAFTLTGCYSVVMLNVGVNRDATSYGAPLDEDVFCAALAAPIVKASPAAQAGAISVHEMNVCREALEAQKNKKQARARR